MNLGESIGRCVILLPLLLSLSPKVILLRVIGSFSFGILGEPLPDARTSVCGLLEGTIFSMFIVRLTSGFVPLRVVTEPSLRFW